MLFEKIKMAYKRAQERESKLVGTSPDKMRLAGITSKAKGSGRWRKAGLARVRKFLLKAKA